MTAYESGILSVLRLAKLERLADVVIAHRLTLQQVRLLATSVLAWVSNAPDSGGVMPDLSAIDALPPAVRDAARAIVAEATANAIAHHRPHGGIN